MSAGYFSGFRYERGSGPSPAAGSGRRGRGKGSRPVEEFSCEIAEHFLFGTLVIRVVRRANGQPAAGMRVAIGDSVEEACGGG